MKKSELIELLRNGEDSVTEFKQDSVQNYDLAKTLVAFLNLEGGTLLLGVEDSGRIAGTSREDLDEWVAELCRTKIEPPILPKLSWARDAEPGRDVLAIHVAPGPDKPYARVHHGHKIYYIRINNTSREASREELQRMYQASGRLRYGLKPVSGADLEAFDRRRLRDYLTRILNPPASTEDDPESWERLLQSMGLMTESAGQIVGTVSGLLLFGMMPSRYVPQSGIRAVCFPGEEKDYATQADEFLRSPMVPLGSADGTVIEPGLVDQAWDFVRRNTAVTARLVGARRGGRTWDYPESVVREALVNAIIHRDYSIAGTEVTLSIFSDRLEIQSPGKLPNTLTIDKLKAGARYARDQTLVNVMRDYGYVEAHGMGIRNKIIPGMLAHNGTEPDLIEDEHQFTVCLWKKRGTRR